jgi:L-ascorbate metabolism protein UlaG (beta-lactamase superfamily)
MTTTHSPLDRPTPSSPHAGLTIEAFGGPTALLSMAGLAMMTDPTFDEPGEYPGDMFTLVKTAPPARGIEKVGPVDAVLLSHDEHADNLDDAGRRYLQTVPLVLSTIGAVERLGGTTTSRPAWGGIDLPAGDGAVIRVTWVPAQHGPEWATAFTGEVTGFVMSGTGLPTVYVSGDNSSLDVVRQVAERCGPIDVALLFAGAGVVHPLDAVLTLTGDEAAEAADILGAPHVVVIHADGWAHFTEGRAEIEAAFHRAGRLDRLTVLAPGAILAL